MRELKRGRGESEGARVKKQHVYKKCVNLFIVCSVVVVNQSLQGICDEFVTLVLTHCLRPPVGIPPHGVEIRGRDNILAVVETLRPPPYPLPTPPTDAVGAVIVPVPVRRSEMLLVM